jgi:oligopeptide transport system permease protein
MNAKLRLALGILVAVSLFCLAGGFFLPAPDGQNLSQQLLPPFSRALDGRHWAGTDALGRDVLARLRAGGLLSLWVAAVATAVSVLVGTIWGAVSGWVGGRTDALMMRIVEILQSLPYMFLVIVLMSLIGRSLWALFLALGLVQWLTIARVVRAQVLLLRNRDHVQASRALGASALRTFAFHVLPGTFPLVMVYATLSLPQIILQEAFLSFLGLNASDNSLGLLVADGAQNMESAPWLVLVPSLFLALLLLSLQLLGDALRDRFDPRT